MTPLEAGLRIAARTLLSPAVLVAHWIGNGERANADDVPASRWSVGAVAKGALDEAFYAIEVLTARLLTAADGRRVGSEVAAALAFFEERGWLAAPAGYYLAPPPLRDVDVAARRSLGRRFQLLSFASEYEPHPGEPGRERWFSYVPNRTAHAWMLEHPGPPRPWLICLHGYRTGFPLTDFVQFPPAWLHHALGLNVLVPVLPLHGPRTAGWRSGEGFASGDFLDTVHLHAQAVWDVRRLVGWLRAREAPAVGVYGVSLGGTAAALVAGFEAELTCVIAGMPAYDLAALFRRHLPPFVRTMAERLGIIWEEVDRLFQIISPLALVPHVAHERRFLYGGIADRLVPPGEVAALWRHWGRPSLGWHRGSHVSFTFERTVRRLVTEALTTAGMIQPSTR
jgi:hypothetical protein